MDDIVSLFPEENTGPSKKAVVAMLSLVVLIGICVMAIAFFGLGPMLVKPTSPISPTKQDVANVLGLNNPQQASVEPLAEKELEQLLGLVSQQTNLPQENNVQAYYITKIESFQSNDFFKQAVNGDIYIIFQPSKVVLLYSKLQGRIINQGQMTEPGN